jgi:hypothetical protein
LPNDFVFQPFGISHFTGGAIMVFRPIMSADVLSSVIARPQSFKNKLVEVIIREAPEDVPRPRIDLANIEHMMDGSITQSHDWHCAKQRQNS